MLVYYFSIQTMPPQPSHPSDLDPKPAKLAWFQRFGLFFYDRRETTLLFWAALVVFGALCYGIFMKRQGFPAVDVPVSVMSGTYFVDSPAAVDRNITGPASQAIGRLPEVKTITARAADNFFLITVEFKEGTSSRAGTDGIQRAIQKAGFLPSQAKVSYKPINATKYVNEFDELVSVYGQSNASNDQTLERRATAIAQALQKYPGVARASVLKQFETGTNPTTGQSTTEKQHFDRLGLRQGDRTEFHTSVTIGVTGKAGQDSIELSNHVNHALQSVSSSPQFADVRTHVSADLAEGIKAQISSLQRNLLEGLAVVLLITFLLISWRASVTSALAMATVMLIVVATLYITNNTLNTVTLFALILSLGLIVDDTTIKVEAIDAAKHMHRRKRDIIALAAKRVSRASAAGTLTTILAFAPMLFVSGILGDFIRVLPVTIIISLVLSLLVSLILVPILSSRLILRGWPRKSQNPILILEQAISNGLARLLRVGKRSKPKGAAIGAVTLLIGLVMVGASLPFFQKLKFDIFPATKDTDTIQVGLSFPPGTPIEQAEQVSDKANTLIGQTLNGNLRRLSYQNTGNVTEAMATVDLVRYENREPTSQNLVSQLDRAFQGFQGARVKVSQLDVGPPAEDLPFHVQIVSEDRTAATHLATDIVAFLRGRSVKRANGIAARITQVEIATPDQVTRLDSKQIVEVRAGFDADDTSALVTAGRDVVKQEFTPSRLKSYGLNKNALTFDFGTESENQESFKTMLIAFPILLVIMYLFMALQFRSYLQPLLIFSAIPYSFFGVAAGLYLTDNPLSFFVLVGFFALIGIALNNTILLTDYANQARHQGAGRIDAIAEAIKARFRPLITTSLTSIVALVPLALSDPFWEALSFTLIFGLLSSTFLVVITFPYVYLFGELLRIFGHKLWRRSLPAFIQYPLDVLIAPIRLIHFLIHIVFHHTY